MQELKLTAEQSAEIEQIVQSSMARLRGDKDDLDRAQSDFRQLMEQPHAPQRELLKAAERLEMARFPISKERTIDARADSQRADAGAATGPRCHCEAARSRAESSDQNQSQK